MLTNIYYTFFRGARSVEKMKQINYIRKFGIPIQILLLILQPDQCSIDRVMRGNIFGYCQQLKEIHYNFRFL